jgi:uncharacterized protein with FMN-binding domain
LRKTLIGLILTFLLVNYACVPEEVKKVREMKINHVDLTNISDGSYQGNFSYGSSTYIVETTVESHKINSIQVLQNRETSHAKKAEGVIQKVLEQQKNDVDVVTGATTTSKAILKAIENSLKNAKKII